VVVLHTGSLEASGGWWLKVPDVEYLDATGQWCAATAQRHLPAVAEGAEPYDKPHFVEYVFAFDRVKTRGLRLRGTARNFTSITELSVFSPIPNR
jgi:hypothetical protein